MKRFTLSIVPIFLFFFGYSQNPQLYQGVSFTFDDTHPVQPGYNIYEAVEFNLFKPGSEYVPYSGASLTARINPYLIFPPPDDPGGPSGLDPDGGICSLTDGKVNISPSGAATYSVPLIFPMGTSGMNPNLALIYNSQGGDGLLGPGWSISGLSEISQIPATQYFDEQIFGVWFTDSEPRYMLDGMRLIFVEKNESETEYEYKTEQETFAKIIKYKDPNNKRNNYFKILTKDGKVIFYGQGNEKKYAGTNK